LHYITVGDGKMIYFLNLHKFWCFFLFHRIVAFDRPVDLRCSRIFQLYRISSLVGTLDVKIFVLSRFPRTKDVKFKTSKHYCQNDHTSDEDKENHIVSIVAVSRSVTVTKKFKIKCYSLVITWKLTDLAHFCSKWLVIVRMRFGGKKNWQIYPHSRILRFTI